MAVGPTGATGVYSQHTVPSLSDVDGTVSSHSFRKGAGDECEANGVAPEFASFWAMLLLRVAAAGAAADRTCSPTTMLPRHGSQLVNAALIYQFLLANIGPKLTSAHHASIALAGMGLTAWAPPVGRILLQAPNPASVDFLIDDADPEEARMLEDLCDFVNHVDPTHTPELAQGRRLRPFVHCLLGAHL